MEKARAGSGWWGKRERDRDRENGEEQERVTQAWEVV